MSRYNVISEKVPGLTQSDGPATRDLQNRTEGFGFRFRCHRKISNGVVAENEKGREEERKRREMRGREGQDMEAEGAGQMKKAEAQSARSEATHRLSEAQLHFQTAPRQISS